MKHKHKCNHCAHTWDCEQPKCAVERAAKSNHLGPFCRVCFHGIYMIRYAEHRGLDPAAVLCKLQQWEREHR